MRSVSTPIIIMLFAFLFDIQNLLMVHARLGNPPLPSLDEEAANAPSNCDTKIENVNVDTRLPPVYRCVSILGICGVTLSEDRCIQLCNDYYFGVNPYARYDLLPGATDVFLLLRTRLSQIILYFTKGQY
ncbi:uncharacterized protein LOC121779192 [Salvia splendens]|uniref:uncharacterized protein LOC121779192 n=1 Tax=Salvia splendens TaxID=180675 RepID=UPI001C261DF6|nr:uncharacterized protein LOC121779192 [Salvia splendens]